MTPQEQLETLLHGISTDPSGAKYNILPLLREWVNQLGLEIYDHSDNMVEILRGNRQMKALILDEDRLLIESEPDRIIYYCKNPEGWGIPDLMEDLKTMMISDCTGCCNAFEEVWLNSQGLIGYCQAGMTYHS